MQEAMINLNIFYYQDTFVADSREVAEMVGRRHDHLLRDIDSFVEIIGDTDSPNLGNGLTMRVSDFFIPYEYEAGDPPRKYRCYLLTRKGCDMVANKLTGRKGILFTAAYVTKFEAMEKALANPNQIATNEAKKLRSEAMHMNAKTRQAQIIKEMAKQFKKQLSAESAQSLIAGISAFLMGTPLLPLPEVERTYTATEIGKVAGVSRYTIGRLANLHGLKTEENGITVLDTIPPKGKQVPVFRYNEAGKRKLLEILEWKEDSSIGNYARRYPDSCHGQQPQR